MKKLLLTSMLFLFSKMRTMGADPDLPRLKAARMYVKSIHSFRGVLISLAALCVCLFLAVSAVVLIHVVILVYTPWTPQTKVFVGLTVALADLLAASWIFSSAFDQDRWLKIFHADRVLERPVPPARGYERRENHANQFHS